MTQTTTSGCPVQQPDTTMTAGHPGPIVLQDVHLLDKLGHFDRERIPERVVYAKGAGAHGYFEVVEDCAALSRAKFLNRIGKRTPLFMRFSSLKGDKGSADTCRDLRGFACKFYTEEGIWDMPGSNSPVFYINDPLKYPVWRLIQDLIHTQKRHPQTNLYDMDAYWDYLSLCPESLHQLAFLFSDRGIPDGYCHMNGYSSHTFKVINAKDEYKFVKFHFKTDQGIKNIDDQHARHLAGSDPDYYARDLFTRIAAGKFPSWSVYVQVMEPTQAANYRWNIFDVTKVWPHSDFPLQQIGKIVLNRNPDNHFAEVEQVAFSPANLVPGIDVSNDKLLQARLFACTDAARYRIGTNFMQIPINCPFTTRVSTTQRDGQMAVNGNLVPFYVQPVTEKKENETSHPVHFAHNLKLSGVTRHVVKMSADDYVQPGVFWRNVLSHEEKKRVVDRMLDTLVSVKKSVASRVIEMVKLADDQWAKMLQDGLATKARV